MPKEFHPPSTMSMNTRLTIRPAERHDVPAILELIYLKADFDGCPDAVAATPETLTATLFSDSPLGFVLLAEVDDAIAGFATYHPIYSTFLARPGLWLDDLYLRPAYRGGGIGKALIQHLSAIATEMGAGRIDWTVDIDNAPAIGFYEAMGATVNRHVRVCRLDDDGIRRLQSAEQPQAHLL